MSELRITGNRDFLARSQDQALVNAVLRSEIGRSPHVDPFFGRVEPPSSVRFIGMQVFSDGTNWNPLKYGVPMWVMWDGTKWTQPVNDPTRRNYLINPQFEIGQRGTAWSFGGDTSTMRRYVSDRWAFEHDGTCAPTTDISRQQMYSGAWGAVDDFPRWCLMFSQRGSTSNCNYRCISQFVEHVDTLAGKTATLSIIWCADNCTYMDTSVSVFQNFGSGGSAAVQCHWSYERIYASQWWHKRSWTFDIPTIHGKSWGTGHNLIVRLEPQFAGDYNWYLGSVQLEEGPIATRHWRRNLAEEITLCQRFCEKSYNIDVQPGSVAWHGMTERYLSHANRFAAGETYFMTPKRTLPVVNVYNPDNGVLGGYAEYNNLGTKVADRTNMTVWNTYENGFMCYPDSPASGNYGRFQWTAEAEY